MRVPYLPIESNVCVIGEKPVFSSKLGQLDLAEVATVSSGDRRHRQQSLWQLEEVCVTAPEFVSIDLCGIPLEGRDGHIGTRFQDGTPSREITQRKAFILPSMQTVQQETSWYFDVHGMVVSTHVQHLKIVILTL